MERNAAERCVCGSLRQATRHVSQIYDAALAPVGLTITGYAILACVDALATAGINEVAQELVMDRSTLSRNLEPLRKARLIHVRTGADRRRKEVTLTAKGRRTLCVARPRWTSVQRNFKKAYGAREASALTRLLSRALGVAGA